MSRGPDRDVTTLDVLEVLVLSPDPAFFVTEIADKLGVSKETVRNRLGELKEDGYVDKKAPNQRTVMFWVTPAGVNHYREMRMES